MRIIYVISSSGMVMIVTVTTPGGTTNIGYSFQFGGSNRQLPFRIGPFLSLGTSVLPVVCWLEDHDRVIARKRHIVFVAVLEAASSEWSTVEDKIIKVYIVWPLLFVVMKTGHLQKIVVPEWASHVVTSQPYGPAALAEALWQRKTSGRVRAVLILYLLQRAIGWEFCQYSDLGLEQSILFGTVLLQLATDQIHSPAKNQARENNTNIDYLGPETAGWGGGLPREGVGVEKLVPSLEKFVFLGFRGR